MPSQSASEKGSDFECYSDNIFFIEDPRELYKHWPADVWKAVDEHRVLPGMNELQASFALGVGTSGGLGRLRLTHFALCQWRQAGDGYV